MSTKTYCDFCGKETFHMDLGGANGKDICPQCMRVRCQNMAKVILDADLEHMRSEQIKYLHSTLGEVVYRLDMLRELKKMEDTE